MTTQEKPPVPPQQQWPVDLPLPRTRQPAPVPGSVPPPTGSEPELPGGVRLMDSAEEARARVLTGDARPLTEREKAQIARNEQWKQSMAEEAERQKHNAIRHGQSVAHWRSIEQQWQERLNLLIGLFRRAHAEMLRASDPVPTKVGDLLEVHDRCYDAALQVGRARVQVRCGEGRKKLAEHLSREPNCPPEDITRVRLEQEAQMGGSLPGGVGLAEMVLQQHGLPTALGNVRVLVNNERVMEAINRQRAAIGQDPI